MKRALAFSAAGTLSLGLISLVYPLRIMDTLVVEAAPNQREFDRLGRGMNWQTHDLTD